MEFYEAVSPSTDEPVAVERLSHLLQAGFGSNHVEEEEGHRADTNDSLHPAAFPPRGLCTAQQLVRLASANPQLFSVPIAQGRFELHVAPVNRPPIQIGFSWESPAGNAVIATLPSYLQWDSKVHAPHTTRCDIRMVETRTGETLMWTYWFDHDHVGLEEVEYLRGLNDLLKNLLGTKEEDMAGLRMHIHCHHSLSGQRQTLNTVDQDMPKEVEQLIGAVTEIVHAFARLHPDQLRAFRQKCPLPEWSRNAVEMDCLLAFVFIDTLRHYSARPSAAVENPKETLAGTGTVSDAERPSDPPELVAHEEEQVGTDKPLAHEEEQVGTNKPLAHEEEQVGTDKPLAPEEEQVGTDKPLAPELLLLLLVNVFGCLLVLGATYTYHAVFNGRVDLGTLMDCFLMLPLIAIDHLWPNHRNHSPHLGQVCVYVMAGYFHLRLWPWQLLISRWPVPLTVQRGYPLPYSLLAPSLLLIAGAFLGLRIIPGRFLGGDPCPCLAMSTLLAGVAHLASVHHDRTMVVFNCTMQVLAFLVTALAQYRFERLKNLWCRDSHLHANDAKIVRDDDTRRLTTADEARYSQGLLADWSPFLGFENPVKMVPISVISVIVAIASAQTTILSSSWMAAWLTISTYAIARRKHAKWIRLACFIVNVFLGNALILMFTPSVNKALAMEPPAMPFFYPEGIHPLPIAIAGPFLVTGVGSFAGLQVSDTAPWTVATSMIGCWHLFEVMERCPFSRMSYIMLSVASAVGVLWAYWGIEMRLRRAWLDKIEVERAEQRHTLTSHV